MAKSGVAIMNLIVTSINPDVFGTFVVSLNSSNPNGFGRHKIKKNDGVMFSNITRYADDKPFPSAVVIEMKRGSLKLAFPDHTTLLELQVGQGKFYIMQAPDLVSSERTREAMESLITGHHHKISSDVVNVIFKKKPISDPATNQITLYYNKRLDQSQSQAINFALNAKEFAIIHGPPGTGKTTVLIEIILQAALVQKQRVLISAASNLAIDNIQKKLRQSKLPNSMFVRIGNPVRVPDDLKKDTLNYKVFQDPFLQAKRKLLKKVRNPKRFNQIFGEMMKKKMARVKDIIMKTQIVLSTLTSAWDEGHLASILKTDQAFDLLIIDECSQSVQAGTMIPLLHAKKVILAGDHKQLPPIIKHHKSKHTELEVSLMEWLLKEFKGSENKFMRMLKIQYRMNEKIMRWSSNMFYNDQVVAHESCRDRTLEDKYPFLYAEDYPAAPDD